MSQHPHQPKRFQVFTELKDGSGFTINGTDFVFKFDKYGGWYDQHGNYYDQNGSPHDSPQEDNVSDDEYSRSDHSFNEEDQYEKEFGGPGKYYEEEDEDTSNYKFLQRIASNSQNLNQYPCNEMIRIHFRNVNYFCKKDQIFNHFKNKVAGLVNVILLQNENNQFNGTGYFIVDGIKSAQDLIKLQGQKFNDRQVGFTIQNVEDFLLDPIKQHQKVATLNDKVKKVYLNKGNTAQPHTVNQYYNSNTKKHVDVQQTPRKVQQKPQKVQVKVQEKPIAKIEQKSESKQIKKEQDSQQFVQYKFLKVAFPKKSSFKQWMIENNVNAQDYKDVQKIEQNKQYAKITMKRKIYKLLNNKFYNGNKIQFTSF